MTRPFFNHPRLHANGIAKLWLLPLKDKRYYTQVNMSTFLYQDLGHGVKLYLPDNDHDAISIKDQPSMIWHEQIIEMRGTKIDNGFRSVRSKAKERMPFLFTIDW
jgi:hypothetical protein